MTENVTKPFHNDVEEWGGYEYSTSEQRSCQQANRRYSDVINESLTFTGKRIVDVGCGDGTYTRRLRAETDAKEILGIDPTAKAIEAARKKQDPNDSSLSFRAAFSSDLVKNGEQFDIAIVRGVIHHVANPQEEITNLLKLAPEVLILEPNGWNPVVKYLEKFSAYHIEHEERSYTIESLRAWVRKGNGQVVRSFFFGLVPMFAPDWLVSLAVTLEPIVERIPVARRLLCGQVVVIARRAR